MYTQKKDFKKILITLLQKKLFLQYDYYKWIIYFNRFKTIQKIGNRSEILKFFYNWSIKQIKNF